MGSACSSPKGVDDISGGETNSARSRRRKSRQAGINIGSDGVRSDSGSERALAEIRTYPHNANLFVDKDETGSPIVEPLTKKNTIMYTGSKQQITNYRSPGAPPSPPSPPPQQQQQPPTTATSFIVTESATTTRVPSTTTTTTTANAVVGNNAVKARLRGGVAYTNVANGSSPIESDSITQPPGRVDSSGMLLQSIDSHSSTSSPLFRNDYGSTLSMDVKGFNRHASENTLAPGEQSFNELPSRSTSTTDVWNSNNNNTTNSSRRRQSSSDHTL